MSDNPIIGFQVDPNDIQYIGQDLQRPECILAEPNGTLWSADARGGVVRITPDGRQQIITQTFDKSFKFTNEIRLDANEEYLYIVETCGQCISRMRVQPDGSLTNREVYGPSKLGKYGFPDGIAFDSYGNLRRTRIPYFKSPVAGLPMVHWKEKLM